MEKIFDIKYNIPAIKAFLNIIDLTLEDKDEVKSADTDIKGRTLNVLITVNDDVELDPAKALTSSVIDNLKKDQTSFYDIQVFISKDNDDTRFPIIGYKHQDKDEFSWTKDR